MTRDLAVLVICLLAAVFIILGTLQIIYAKRVARWVNTVFWPSFFGFLDWLLFERVNRLNGSGSRSPNEQSSGSRTKAYRPPAGQVWAARLVGIWCILAGLGVLVTALKVFL
ncbi:MAG: hypothetical protein Q7T04_02895 [Dehalococcoidia bacterium]|nr:hypothetical protein [Dehalococcoidia bacterium]